MQVLLMVFHLLGTKKHRAQRGDKTNLRRCFLVAWPPDCSGGRKRSVAAVHPRLPGGESHQLALFVSTTY